MREWKFILAALVFQYLHGVATKIAYYFHKPAPEPLPDLGFALVPPLPESLRVVSEIVFFVVFISTLLFMATPFSLCMRHRTAALSLQMYLRFGRVLVLSQCLRIASFLVTSLPGPNYHCRLNSPEYNPPRSFKGLFLNPDPFKGCGDLIFSSHTIFMLLCALTINKYGRPWMRRIMWTLVMCFAVLCISARKHYTVDVVVAMYTVPLVWVFIEKVFPDEELTSDGAPLSSPRITPLIVDIESPKVLV